MTPLLLGGIAIIAFMILVFNKMPIAFSFALVGFFGLYTLKGSEAALLFMGTIPYSWGTSEGLIPLTLFVLMGQFVFYSGISRDLYSVGNKWLGHFPGGIALATTVAATFFGACCGVSMAGAATFASVAYPEMENLKYDRGLSTGCIIAGGGLSSLIPPSVAFLLIGFLTQTSIAQLFMAGIIPGILLSGLFLISIYIRCKRNPELGNPGPRFSMKEKIRSLKGITGMLVLFILVIGGLYGGVFTPTEAGACGALGALIIAIIGRRIKFSDIIAAARETTKVTCFVVTMVIGANIFNTFLGVCGITTTFSEWLGSLTLQPMLILAIILIMYIPLGMFLDIAAILILTIPIVFQPLVNMGYDPVWLGVIIIILAELGFMTPPVGLNSFVVAGVTNVPVVHVFRGVLPFALMMLLAIIIMVMFPGIVTMVLK